MYLYVSGYFLFICVTVCPKLEQLHISTIVIMHEQSCTENTIYSAQKGEKEQNRKTYMYMYMYMYMYV